MTGTANKASAFSARYESFIEQIEGSQDPFGFELQTLASIEPILRFLHKYWWRIETSGLERLPDSGAAMIVGNTSGAIPWTALMLIYTLMSDEKKCRRINIVCDMEWIKDKQLYQLLVKLGFVPWSSANVKELLANNQLIAIFPEGVNSLNKTVVMENRVCEFDWTRFLPAVEAGVKIFPLATLGCDEASPTLFNSEILSKALNCQVFPVSPFFPWLPFPFNLGSLPIRWQMHLLPASPYKVGEGREQIQACAKEQALHSEGAIQSELNRLLRIRHRVF